MSHGTSHHGGTPRYQGGFTLLELVITLLIAGMCAGLGWQAFVTSTESLIFRGQLSTIADQGRLAMLRITRELREADRTGFIITPNTEISFSSRATKNANGAQDPQGNVITDGIVRYYLNGTDLHRTIVATGEDNILAKGIQDLTFSYDTADPATFTYVQVQFSVKSVIPGNELAKFPLRDRIYPRGF
ncbi:MAG: prepilin-type N-terminal cleavage/methylation domain-containing protein [Magnetococcales bacterium]|nr:prepilin-type N-terminal cleavage/methylation domain-containing protein [Magnetococcales bacterium]